MVAFLRRTPSSDIAKAAVPVYQDMGFYDVLAYWGMDTGAMGGILLALILRDPAVGGMAPRYEAALRELLLFSKINQSLPLLSMALIRIAAADRFLSRPAGLTPPR